MPSKKKANNDESRAEDLPALDSVTEDAPAAHSSRATATAIAPANVSDDKEVAEIKQLLDTGTDYSELVRLRKLLVENCERLPDDLIRSLLKKFQVSEKGQKKTLLKRLRHIVNPTPGDLKQMDTDELCGKKTSYEQLVSYFFETHGYLPVKNTKKKDLAKEIIDAKTSGHNFYLHLSIDGIKVELAKYGRRYYNLTVQRKTLVDHLRAIEESHENKPDDDEEDDDEEDDDERNDGLVVGGEESERNDQNGLLEFSGEEGGDISLQAGASASASAGQLAAESSQQSRQNKGLESFQERQVLFNEEVGQKLGIQEKENEQRKNEIEQLSERLESCEKKNDLNYIKNKNLEEDNERLRNEIVVLKRRLDALTPLESD